MIAKIISAKGNFNDDNIFVLVQKQKEVIMEKVEGTGSLFSYTT